MCVCLCMCMCVYEDQASCAVLCCAVLLDQECPGQAKLPTLLLAEYSKTPNSYLLITPKTNK